jgi:hypothetical protein
MRLVAFRLEDGRVVWLNLEQIQSIIEEITISEISMLDGFRFRVQGPAAERIRDLAWDSGQEVVHMETLPAEEPDGR